MGLLDNFDFGTAANSILGLGAGPEQGAYQDAPQPPPRDINPGMAVNAARQTMSPTPGGGDTINRTLTNPGDGPGPFVGPMPPQMAATIGGAPPPPQSPPAPSSAQMPPGNGPLPQGAGADLQPWAQPGQQQQPAALPPKSAPTQGVIPPGVRLPAETPTGVKDDPRLAGGGPFLNNLLGGDPRRTQQIAASLGAGLKSVGDNWNKPGLAAFAGSAGSALQGGQAGDAHYTEEAGKAVDRMQRAQHVGNEQAFRKAQDDYWKGRLKLQQEQGTVSGRSAAYQMSPQWQLQQADKFISDQVDQLRKLKQQEYNNGSKETRQRIEDEIKTKEDSVRERVYKARGIDPDKIDKIRTMGLTKDNPHTPMTPDDFNVNVKPGEWFINPKDGAKYKRKSEAPPAADAQGGVLATTPENIGGGQDFSSAA
jgi:hypothetical protein